MLRMVLKNGEKIKLGEDIIVKSMTDGRCELAIDAPREVKIERIVDEDDLEQYSALGNKSIKTGKKSVMVKNSK